MRRREFITGLSATVLPAVARAQQGDHSRRIGVLMQVAENDPEAQVRMAAFRDELKKYGWIIGGNLQIEYRWGASVEGRARTAARELVAQSPDAVFVNSTVPLRAMQEATSTVPIVFTSIIEPMGQGFIASLAHPGGNTTGFSYLEVSVGGKWLHLLKEVAPRTTHVACMFNPQRGPYSVGISLFAQEAAQQLGVQYVAAPVFEPAHIEPVMATVAREPNGAVIVSPDALTVTNRPQIIALAARYRLPAVYAERIFAADGGMLSYGADYVDHFRQAASYVDRILRGAKPADLPVQQPSKFYLVINLKTAGALGLAIPETLLATANELIE
jgi:putative ABC transport system substrate-binding protein